MPTCPRPHCGGRLTTRKYNSQESEVYCLNCGRTPPLPASPPIPIRAPKRHNPFSREKKTLTETRLRRQQASLLPPETRSAKTAKRRQQQ